MEIVGMGLMWIGIVGIVVFGIMLLIKQFQTSILWGLACLLIPFASLVWLVMYWDEGKMLFLYGLLSIVIMIIGITMSGQLESLATP